MAVAYGASRFGAGTSSNCSSEWLWASRPAMKAAVTAANISWAGESEARTGTPGARGAARPSDRAAGAATGTSPVIPDVLGLFAGVRGVLDLPAGFLDASMGVGDESPAAPALSAAAAGSGTAPGRLGVRERVVRRFSGSSAGLMT